MSNVTVAMMDRRTKAQRAADAKAEAIEHLRELCPPGSTILCVLGHASRSGMSRRINFYSDGPDPVYLSGLIEKLGHYKRPANGDGLRVDGCGMDMGFAVVYDTAQTLYPDGFDCIGDRCPSNDHSNRENNAHHRSGGYAIRHRWL